MTYALDSNIISYLLKKDLNVFKRSLEEVKTGNVCVIPPVAYYEIKRGLLAVQATSKMNHFNDLCRDFAVEEMSKTAWDEAARLYAEHRTKNTIEDADIFIAAFCIANDYTLVTNNTKHFEQIGGLRFANWAQ